MTEATPLAPTVRRIATAATLNGLHEATSVASARAAGMAFRKHVPKASRVTALVPMGSGCSRLWVPHATTGASLTALVLTEENESEPVKYLGSTATVPSGRVIGSVLSTASTQNLFASDDVGNVYVLHQRELPEEPDHKRRRLESAQGSVAATAADDDARGEPWDLVTSSDACETMRGALTPTGCGGGWVGLTALQGESSLVSAREHYHDLRVLDVTTCQTVRSLYTMHAPRCVDVLPSLSDSTFVVAEGPLITVWDARHSSRLPVQRQTFANGRVNSVAFLSDYEVVSCHEDRTVAVWDIRNWNRLRSQANVLKHEALHVVPICNASYIVCSGVDSEVRVLSAAFQTNKSAGGSLGKAGDAADESDNHAVSTFRSRISETEHCESTWYGMWAPLGGANGRMAVGMTATNEIYIAS